jgi:tetratricopeptide (TPR) repeat protein
MSFRHAVGFLLMMIAGVLPGLGQSQPASHRTYSIEGTVRDDLSQRAMGNVRVDLKQSAGNLISTTFTRGGGVFEFSGLSNGDYTIEIELAGYAPFQAAISIYNSARQGFSIFLSRPATVASASSRGSVSVHELSAPRKAREEFEKGLYLFYSKSDYRGAIAQFQHAIKDFPNYYEAYAQEGSAYFNLKEIAAAEESMRKSVELSSGHYPEALFLLAGLLNNTNRSSEAETVSRRGVAIDAASWRGHFELARALSALKQPAEAEKSAIQALDLKPDNPQIYLLLANIHVERLDYAALLKDLDGYLKLVPVGPEADQARKTREVLQADMQKAQAQPQSNQQPQSNEREQPKSNEQSRSNEQQQSDQSSEQDPPLLPPLPPPQLQQ